MDFTEVARMAMIDLQKPKAIIGRRATRDLRGRGKRPRLVCRVSADGKIRARSHYDQMADAVRELAILANQGNEFAIGALDRLREFVPLR